MNHSRIAQAMLMVGVMLFLVMLFFSSLAAAQAPEYSITPETISQRLKIDEFVEVPITVDNTGTVPLAVSFAVDGPAAPLITFNQPGMTIDPNSQDTIRATIFGHNISIYDGFIVVSGDISQDIPLNITVTDSTGLPVEALLIDIEPITDRAEVGSLFNFEVGIQNLLSDRRYNITVHYSIDRIEEDRTYKFDRSFFEEVEQVELGTSVSIVKEFDMPDFIRPGTYVINVQADYLGISSSASRTFRVVEPFWDNMILGILPMRWAFFVGFFVLSGLIGFIWWRRKKAKQKRYTVKIDYALLPKAGPRSVYLGYIAESNRKAYFELEQLTTHTLIAGSTGGGKTVSAEVLVEEALQNDVAVVVFDPTAQWTGFLRKNTDKKMFALYPKFGMKKSEAKAFNGNIRQILNAREIIDIKRYMKPGEINVFSVNRLDPEDIDTLVANTIREIFRANLGESRVLRLMIIFDEVHRLLPKFGGSGQGFIQIERAAREFRKWGVGLMLISQVLTDFIGETKANINTEIQMRTRDQGDLDRIKNKYGGYMLQSLIKSSTGTGMLENASYNKGNPYFISFRPLLHEHARLSDNELDKYNEYNNVIDDLEFQIDELEKQELDVFDFRLELKMALDKVKAGSFNMVDIYLEGLTPRVHQTWEKLGIPTPKRQSRLVSESELREEFAKAQEARKKFEAEEKEKGPAGGVEGDTQLELLTLKNGVAIGSKNDLADALEVMDENIFKQHVTDTKNDFAGWMQKADPALAQKMRAAKTKAGLQKVLTEQ